ncbi:MAG: hypothetical protein DRR03_01580 [Gammaproteobacteria bacterium]|nr:MAG: hypothetical protein DRR03_01580 [Gammaproteobacteria bacterium]
MLLLLLAIWIALVLIRDVLRRRRIRTTSSAPVVTTVCCAHCGVHLPTHRALQHVDGRHYCSPEHARGDG